MKKYVYSEAKQVVVCGDFACCARTILWVGGRRPLVNRATGEKSGIMLDSVTWIAGE